MTLSEIIRCEIYRDTGGRFVYIGTTLTRNTIVSVLSERLFLLNLSGTRLVLFKKKKKSRNGFNTAFRQIQVHSFIRT